LYQFSLRTLLIVTTLAAVGCWWFLQPKVHEEELAGKYLKLRRQVQFDEHAHPESHDPFHNVGSWQLLNEHADLLVAGQYAADEPHGKWTIRHASGRKAAEGDVFRGMQAGLWRVWDEEGTLRSEATYRVVEDLRPMGGLGPGKGKTWMPAWNAQRHGPARGWHANGQLAFEGQYASDRREGLWKWFDEQGNIIEQGEFKTDLRAGWWLVGGERMEYVAGRTRQEHDALLARLADDLASDDSRRQLAAVDQLEALGPAGLALLSKQLNAGGDDVKLLALRAIVQQDAVPADLAARIEPLADHADPRLALRALAALYLAQPERRATLFAHIARRLDEVDRFETKAEVLRLVCRHDPDQRPAAFLRLVKVLAEAPATSISCGRAYPTHSEWLLEIESDLIPLLAQAFASPDPGVRLYVLLVLEQVVKLGPPIAGDPFSPARWETPAAIQPLLDRATLDPDPAVREQAESIGAGQSNLSFSGGFSAFSGPL
jgi:hypothetical protein